MGCFRTVYCDLPCAHCGAVQSQGVQFKTGNDYAFPRYNEGEWVDDLIPGDYEGIGEILCHRCVNEWLEVQRQACFTVIAEMVTNGEVMIEHFSSGYLETIAPKKRDSWPEGTISSPCVAVSSYFGLSFEDFRRLRDRTDERLVEKGWPADMDRDLLVQVDAQHRVKVLRPDS